jgi:iron complex outermembrane recepter protein
LLGVILKYLACVLALIIGFAPGWAYAQLPAPQTPPTYQTQDLKRLSIEELSQIDITTVSRRVEQLSHATAAVSVLRHEDLRRAGVTTLAEAVRLATGIHAAQVFGSGWAISARGFNISTANKLLVAIDGRTVYSPVFSGVFWESQDVLLDDVDRIEVIRGPGGTLWGANAVNGVINIITRPATDTRGFAVTAGAGTVDRGVAAIRYGAPVGAGGYRVYAQVRATDDREFVSGGSAKDDLQFAQTGFRFDSATSGATRWTVQGDLFSAVSGLADRADVRMSGGNVVSRLTHDFSATSAFQVQAYYDRTYRRVPLQYQASRDTFDVDTQQRLRVGNRHHVVFGAGARVSRGDDLGDGPGFFFEPQVRTSTLFSGFVQDEFAVVRDRLFVTVGTKIERNDFSGVEVQPTVRARWSVGRQTIWGAVSRAVRMPTRFDTDLRIRLGATGRLFLTGSEDFKSENVIAYEGGYRLHPADWLSLDLAAYTNRYTDLRSQELPLSFLDPIVLANTMNARTAGAEISATAQVFERWRLQGWYAYLWKEFSRDPGSRDATNGASEANDPSHVALLRSYFDLGKKAELDAVLRFSSALPAPALKAYAELTLRLGWRIRPGLDLSIIGQNLLHDRHEEFVAGTPREYLHRGVHLRATWRY